MSNSKENIVVCKHRTNYENALNSCLGVEDVNAYLNGFKIETESGSKMFNFGIKITDSKDTKDLKIPIHHVLTIKKNDESFDEKLSILEEANVWFMVWVTKTGDIRILQVASSNDIEKEIAEDLGLMLFVNQSKCDNNENIKAYNTQFWENSYMRPKETKSRDKRKYIYPKIYAELAENDNERIEIYSIGENDEDESEKILENLLSGLQGSDSNLESIKNSIMKLWNECKEKYYIYEALFAFYTQALYWNASRFKADQKVINILTGYKQPEKRLQI